MDDSHRDAIIAATRQKIAELLNNRLQIKAERERLDQRDREVDRGLADVRATARLFNLDLQLPSADDPGALRGSVGQSAIVHVSRPRLTVRETAHSEPLPLTEPPKRPPIRDIVLERVEEAGSEGTRAARIRRYIERVYGNDLHEKTVGMTLYRLKQDGLVRRDGQTWFFVPPQAETENPGAGTPGPDNDAD